MKAEPDDETLKKQAWMYATLAVGMVTAFLTFGPDSVYTPLLGTAPFFCLLFVLIRKERAMAQPTLEGECRDE